MHLGIITYDYPHLKTEQLVHAFVRSGYRITVFGLPFVPRRPRKVLFSHRPEQANAAHPRMVCERFGLTYKRCETDSEIANGLDIYHVLVGKIISAACITEKRIINCHPGVIPAVRGLDSFKWAILNRQPLGNTLHYIDAEVDMGEIIAIEATPVYATDTLEQLARRHYEVEVDMVANFASYIESSKNPFRDVAEGMQTMRMTIENEHEMLSAASDYIRIMSGKRFNA